MKKTKIVLLTAIMMATLMLFSSCFSSSVSLKDILSSDTEMPKEADYTKNQLLNDLTDATFKAQEKDLVYFTADVQEGISTYEKHIVYNLETNRIIYTATESISTDIEISLKNEYKGCCYFISKTTSMAMDNGFPTGDSTVTISLFNNEGTKIADAEGDTDIVTALDILYFDGKCYRMSDDGAISYVFDYSEMAAFPKIIESSENYYYAVNTNPGEANVTVYDKNLDFVSKHSFPAYANMTACEILENGNIFAQYVYTEDDYAEDYTFAFISDSTTVKYTLVTEVINAKNAKAKNVDCDYVLEDIYNRVANKESVEEDGLDFDEAFILAEAHKIENQRFIQDDNSYRFVTISNSGKVSEFDTINGEHISSIHRFDNDCWIVYTESNKYLVDEDGDIIGDISNASNADNKYIAFNGQFYDHTLSSVFNYKKKDLTVVKYLDNAVLFTNEKGELLLYTGGENTTTLIAEGSARRVLYYDYATMESDYFVIHDSTDINNMVYEIYNGSGSKIMTVNGEENLNVAVSVSIAFKTVATTENAKLIKLVNDQNQTVYYRLSVN